MNNINVEEILAKYSPNFKLAVNYERQEKALITTKQAKAAIKEIIEAVIDKCADGANTRLIETGIGNYEEIDKDSILNIKTIINYG